MKECFAYIFCITNLLNEFTSLRWMDNSVIFFLNILIFDVIHIVKLNSLYSGLWSKAYTKCLLENIICLGDTHGCNAINSTFSPSSGSIPVGWRCLHGNTWQRGLSQYSQLMQILLLQSFPRHFPPPTSPFPFDRLSFQPISVSLPETIEHFIFFFSHHVRWAKGYL